MNRKLITQAEIEELQKSGKNILTVHEETIITPAARDLIAKYGITVKDGSISSGDADFCGDHKEYKGAGSLQVPAPSYSIETFPQELVLRFYYYMLKIRLFEELVKNYKEKNMIPGVMVHSYIGQEAIAAGVCSALTDGDFLTSTHRGHGHLIAKGADLDKMLAEMLGKADGYCRGKGGSMHITDIGLGILGANGIVGAGMPIACGSALASKLNKDKFITVSFFGDGASNQGTFGESLNFARIFSLPVLFLCENNGYAISTPVTYGCGRQSIHKRGIGYDIYSEYINGDDIFEVYSVCKKHIDMMRANPQPVLIEAVTHRHIGHWVGDPQNYRALTEIKKLPEFDPIRIFLSRIKALNEITETKLEEVEKKVIDEIRKAAKFAADSPYPMPGEAIKDFLKE